MEYELDLSDKIYKIFTKLKKREVKRMKIINKKVQQILKDPHHFKPLKKEMSGVREVHIEKSFVLTYKIDEENKIIRLLDFDHHDKIFK